MVCFFVVFFLLTSCKGVSFGKRIEAHKSYGERESIGDIGGSLQMTFTPQEVKVCHFAFFSFVLIFF